MREIVLDTETTGLDPKAGHRLVEIGCVELINRIPTPNQLQIYINPERDMPDEAFRVHGLSESFLRNQPVFADIAEKLLTFIGDDPLVIHNADFDTGFLNWELGLIGYEPLAKERIIDTLPMARKKFPGAPASLDALCKRFDIDNSSRNLHGALLDAQLLAEVYLELTGGRQTALGLIDEVKKVEVVSTISSSLEIRAPRPHAPTSEELQAHQAFIQNLTQAIWLKK